MILILIIPAIVNANLASNLSGVLYLILVGIFIVSMIVGIFSKNNKGITIPDRINIGYIEDTEPTINSLSTNYIPKQAKPKQVKPKRTKRGTERPLKQPPKQPVKHVMQTLKTECDTVNRNTLLHLKKRIDDLEKELVEKSNNFKTIESNIRETRDKASKIDESLMADCVDYVKLMGVHARKAKVQVLETLKQNPSIKTTQDFIRTYNSMVQNKT